MEIVLGATCLGVTAAVGLLLILFLAKHFLFIARPHEVLIVSGRRKRATADAESQGYQPIFHGRIWRKPFLEKVDRMDLRTIPIDIHTTNAYSKGGIPLNVHAVANVKVTNNPKLIMNAVERFLGRDPGEIRRVAKETLEGHLRGVLARLTPEEVNEDRLKFANELMDEAEEDLFKLGIHLDTLKVQNVSDDVTYLDSIGRERIATVIRDAEIAESKSRALAEQAEAEANQRSQVASQTAETNIIKQANNVRRYKAEQDATAKAEEERMLQMVAQARAEAEIELQEVRQRLEKTRLIADVVLPAQAQREAERLRAHGDAARIAEDGKAMAHVLELMTQQWVSAGKDAKDIFLIQQLEAVLQTIVSQVNNVQIDEVILLDGGGGSSLPALVSAYPAMVAGILKEIKQSTGVDIAGILSGTTGPSQVGEV